MRTGMLRTRSLLLMSAAMLATGGAVCGGSHAAMSPIDTNAPYYLASQLGITVTPEFRGGTLRIDQPAAALSQTFPVYYGSGYQNRIDLYGQTAVFSGVLTDGDPTGFPGYYDVYGQNLAVTSSNGTGTIVFTGTAQFLGNLTVDQNVVLDFGNGGLGPTVIGTLITNDGLVVFNHTNDIKYITTIHGSGAVEVAGTGKVIMGECLCYGGLTIDAGATAEGASFRYGRNTVNGTLLSGVTGGRRQIGTLDGSGVVHVNAGGDIGIGDASTFTGTILIDQGGMLSGPVHDVVDNGFFRPSLTNGAYSGTISGAGDVEFHGTRLGATYSGNTTISGVTHITGLNVIVGGPNALSPNSALLIYGIPEHWVREWYGSHSYWDRLIPDDYADLTLQSDATVAGFEYSAETRLGRVHLDGHTLNVRNGGSFDGTFDGTGTLNLMGGTLSFGGAATHSGGTTVGAGAELDIGRGGTAGTVAGNIADSGVVVFNRSDTVVYDGVISGTGSVVQAGSGTLIFTGDHTYTGGTTINAGGTLQLGNGGSSGSIKGNVLDNGRLAFSHSASSSNRFNGVISGTGGVDVLHGSVNLYGMNTYTGGTTIAEGATLMLAGERNAPAGNLVGDIVNDGRLYIGWSNLYFYSGNISGTGTVDISCGQDDGCGGFFRGTNTYSGKTTIYNGDLLQDGPNALSQASRFDVRGFDPAYAALPRSFPLPDPGYAVLSIGNYDAKIAGLDGNKYATVALGSHALEITGGGRFDGAVTGTGTLRLTGGAFEFGGNASAPVGVYIGTGATLKVHDGERYTRYDPACLRCFMETYEGRVSGAIVNDGELVYSGTFPVRGDYLAPSNISGRGNVTVQGSRTVVLSGALSYSGKTTIDANSKLRLSGTGNLTGDIVVNGTLVTNGRSLSGTITGAGILQTSSGTLVVTGSAVHTGGTVIDTGSILQIGTGGTTGSITGNILDNGGLVFKRSDTLTYGGVVSGTGTLQQLGAGTLVLNGVNSYTGMTTVGAGTLMVGDASHTGATIAGPVTVAAGAKLMGHGKVLGAITNNGTVEPGGSIGTLTVASFSQGDGGTLFIDVTQNANSSLTVTGSASLAGTLVFSFAPEIGAWRSLQFLTAASVSGRFASVVSNRPDWLVGLRYGATGLAIGTQSPSSGQLYADVVSSRIDSAHFISQLALDGSPEARGEDGVSVWLTGYGGTGAFDSLTRTAQDYATRMGGLIGGADWRLGAGQRIGMVLGMDESGVGVHGGWGRASTHTFTVGVTGGTPLMGAELSGGLFYAATNGASERDLGADGMARGRPGSHALSGALQALFPVEGSDVTPLIRLSAVKVFNHKSAETGADLLDVSTLAREYDSVRAGVGVRYRRTFHTGDGLSLTPGAEAGIDDELATTGRPLTMVSTDGTGNAVQVPYARHDRAAAFAKLGLEVGNDEGLSLAIWSSGRVGGHQRSGAISLQGSYRF